MLLTPKSNQHQVDGKQRSHSHIIQTRTESPPELSLNDKGMSQPKRHSDFPMIPNPNNGFLDVFGDAREDVTSSCDNPSDQSLVHQHGMEHTLKPAFPMSSESTGIDTRHFILASQGAIKVFG